MRLQKLREALLDHRSDTQNMKKGCRSRTMDVLDRQSETAALDTLAGASALRAKLKEQLAKAVGKLAFTGTGLQQTPALAEAAPASEEGPALDKVSCCSCEESSNETLMFATLESQQYPRRPTSLVFERGCDHFDMEPPRTRRHSYAAPSPNMPPREYFCPVSRRLMTEPVTLLNTGVTLSRTAMQAWLRTGSRVCPVTGQELSGWVAMESNEKLRSRIRAWASEQGLNFELLDNAAVLLARWRGSGLIAEEDEQVITV